jgi:hypothetical protein
MPLGSYVSSFRRPAVMTMIAVRLSLLLLCFANLTSSQAQDGTCPERGIVFSIYYFDLQGRSVSGTINRVYAVRDPDMSPGAETLAPLDRRELQLKRTTIRCLEPGFYRVNVHLDTGVSIEDRIEVFPFPSIQRSSRILGLDQVDMARISMRKFKVKFRDATLEPTGGFGCQIFMDQSIRVDG